jgi:P pilus assembly chaperone PapD
MSTVQAITLAIAVLGAVLGIINTWHNLDKMRVKLVVRPKHAIPLGAANPKLTFCIEVTNLSSFAVTIAEVGVHYYGTSARGAIIHPVSSVTIYGQNPATDSAHRIRCAYATTECGATKRATSPALKQISQGGL